MEGQGCSANERPLRTCLARGGSIAGVRIAKSAVRKFGIRFRKWHRKWWLQGLCVTRDVTCRQRFGRQNAHDSSQFREAPVHMSGGSDWKVIFRIEHAESTLVSPSAANYRPLGMQASGWCPADRSGFDLKLPWLPQRKTGTNTRRRIQPRLGRIWQSNPLSTMLFSS